MSQSGHGGSTKDLDGDEDDGMDEVRRCSLKAGLCAQVIYRAPHHAGAH